MCHYKINMRPQSTLQIQKTFKRSEQSGRIHSVWPQVVFCTQWTRWASSISSFQIWNKTSNSSLISRLVFRSLHRPQRRPEAACRQRGRGWLPSAGARGDDPFALQSLVQTPALLSASLHSLTKHLFLQLACLLLWKNVSVFTVTSYFPSACYERHLCLLPLCFFAIIFTPCQSIFSLISSGLSFFPHFLSLSVSLALCLPEWAARTGRTAKAAWSTNWRHPEPPWLSCSGSVSCREKRDRRRRK